MPQAALLTSPCPPILAAALLLALCTPPEAAAANESVYTKLDLHQCKDVTPEEIKDNGSVSICPGYQGIEVRVAEGDLRIFVSYGPNAANQAATYETLPQFNTIGETLEWRVKGQGAKPFATILRFHWDADDRQGSTLVVTKLDGAEACHMAYVEATNNPKANELARAVADKETANFTCKKDKAKTY
jgi:hypothetical protein